MKWHKLQEKREHQVNLQLMEELRKLDQIMDVELRTKKLEEVELQQEKLVGEEQVSFELKDGEWMSETSIEAIEPYDFEMNNLCMFAGGVKEDKEERQNFSFETAGSHMEDHTELRGGIFFSIL